MRPFWIPSHKRNDNIKVDLAIVNVDTTSISIGLGTGHLLTGLPSFDLHI